MARNRRSAASDPFARKRVRLTVEWQGACGEELFSTVLRKAIEEFDVSRRAAVVEVELLTNVGETDPLVPRAA